MISKGFGFVAFFASVDTWVLSFTGDYTLSNDKFPWP
jgi:hypothetical protein